MAFSNISGLPVALPRDYHSGVCKLPTAPSAPDPSYGPSQSLSPTEITELSQPPAVREKNFLTSVDKFNQAYTKLAPNVQKDIQQHYAHIKKDFADDPPSHRLALFVDEARAVAGNQPHSDLDTNPNNQFREAAENVGWTLQRLNCEPDPR